MQIGVDDLDSSKLDVLREVGNIGAGNAVTALAKMLNKRVDMSVPKMKILDFSEIPELLGDSEEPVVGILLAVTGDIQGSILFIMDQVAARTMVRVLMGLGNYETVDGTEFNEIELSALKEAGNILAGSYLSALAMLTNLNILPTIPDLCIDMAGSILSVPAMSLGAVSDTVLYIQTEFFDGSEKLTGEFFLIPDIQSYEILLRALGVIG